MTNAAEARDAIRMLNGSVHVNPITSSSQFLTTRFGVISSWRPEKREVS